MRPIEDELIEIFEAMQQVVARHRRGPFGSFGRGHDMHADARKVAPQWLLNWDDDHRWAICFSMNWTGFVQYANAFGVPKSQLLAEMEGYRSRCQLAVSGSGGSND